MLELAHALTGATLAIKIQNPWLSLPFSFLSHFLIDLLPHWNPNLKMTKKKEGLFYLPPKTVILIVIDCLVGLFLSLFLTFRALPDFNRALIIAAGTFLAILPDLAEAPYFFFGYKSQFVKHLIFFQKKLQWKASFLPGILFQILYVTLLLAWVL
ncbi:MAG TPA: hypothetical protein VMW04_00480 [Patescibacteria group bacterium]|nr:hypothetical protein [Patescibacteria group bacterium]